MTAITLLTQQSCGPCERAKAILARLTNEYDLTITEVSLDSEQGGELAMRHGVMFAPGLLIDGVMFSYGRLSEGKLRRQLERRDAELSARQTRR